MFIIKVATVLWYMLVNFGLLVSFRLLHNPCFIRIYFSSVFHCSGNVHGWVSVYFIQSVAKERVRAMLKQGWGGWGHAGGKTYYYGVRAKLLWCVIYCANMRPDPGSQSVSRSCREMGIQALQIMWDYDLTTSIAIRPLTHLRMCERGSSVFVTMS